MEQSNQQRPLAQDGDAMFQRNIALLASRKREVEIKTPNGTWIGFLTGLDEFTIQLCESGSLKYILISREGSLSIEETGRSFYNVKTHGTLKENEIQTLEGKIKKFAEITSHYAPGSKKGQTSDGEHSWDEVRRESEES